MFKERFLLLTNDSAVGVFNQDRKTVFIALSKNGEFVKVYEGDSSFIHLTRFCPVSVYPLVQKLLNFRNQYAHRPYLSERFVKTSSHFNGSRTISWSLETQKRTTKNFWKVYSNGDERSLIAVCPHKKKMCYLSDAIFLPASSMNHHQAQLSSEFRVTRLVTVVPFAHAPTFFQRDYDKNSGRSNKSLSMLGANIMTEIPTSIECGASDSSSACHFFQEIEHELTFLKSDKKYPTCADFAVKIEIIDGEIFLFTQCDLTTGEQSQDIIVESWIQPPREKRIINRNTLSSTQMDVAYVEEEEEGRNMSVADFGCNGGGPILTLNGDYFIFYHDQYTSSGGTDMSHENDHSMTGVSIHISLIEQTCQEMENAKFETHAQSYNENMSENSSENWLGSETSKDTWKKNWRPNHNISNSSNSAQERLSTNDHRRSDLKSEVEINVGEDDSSLQIQNILRRYRQHAIHLLEYRHYLQVRRKHLGASSYTPHCLKPIGGDREKTGINYFSRDRAISAVAGRQEHRQGHRQEHRQGQGYGGSYYVKNLELHEVFCDNADSRIGSTSRSNGHPSDIDTNSYSFHNDNSSDSNPSNVHQCVKLQTSDGTRFTAYPNPEAALNTQKCVSAKSYGDMIKDEYGLACIRSECDFYEEGKDHADQYEHKKIHRGTHNDPDQGMFCRVRGVFPDRTQLDLCLKSKVVKALLPNGEEISVTLKECFSPPTGLEIVESIMLLKYHLTSLISFHTFACTSPEVRKGFMREVRNRSALTQAAITRSERYLTIQKIQSGVKVDKFSRMSSSGDYRGGQGSRETRVDDCKKVGRKEDDDIEGDLAVEKRKSEQPHENKFITIGRCDVARRKKVRTLEIRMREALLLSKNALLSNANLLQRSELK